MAAAPSHSSSAYDGATPSSYLRSDGRWVDYNEAFLESDVFRDFPAIDVRVLTSIMPERWKLLQYVEQIRGLNNYNGTTEQLVDRILSGVPPGEVWGASPARALDDMIRQ